jgi:hypothetical protein
MVLLLVDNIADLDSDFEDINYKIINILLASKDK